MVASLSVLALLQTGDLSRLHHTFRPMTAGTGSSPPCQPDLYKGKNMDGWKDEKLTDGWIICKPKLTFGLMF